MAVARATRLLLPLALLAGCGSGGGGTGVNVLLISLDSTRRDLLGAYGFESARAPGRSSSPNLDRLAAEGVLMEDAYSTTSWTLPSHMSLLTGQPELVHAVDIDYLRPDRSRPTLAGALRARGYRTAGFYSGPYLDPRFGFAQGFDRYEDGYGPALAKASRELRAADERVERAGPADGPAARAARQQALLRVEALSHEDVSSRSVVDAALSELEAAAAAGGPFFLFTHFFDPHYDYVAPAPHDTAFDPDYAGELDGRDFWANPKLSEPDPEHPGLRVRRASERDLEHVRALYAGELAWTDAQIGRLLDKLGELGLAQNTLVIVTADHGDEFFEHGSLGHRRTLFEEVVRVPMILRLPGALAANRRVGGLVSTVDVVPTVLELLALPSIPGLTSSSMVGLIDGREDGAERAVFGRLLTVARIGMRAPSSGDAPIPGQLIRVQETYRKGPIKIVRERSWPEASGPVPPAARAALDKKRDEDHARERLVWIDVERNPAEHEADHSSDFADPRARAALEEFRDRYVELLRERTGARLQDDEDGPLVGLGGLGYTAGTAPADATAIDRFVLPPPGIGVVGKPR